MSKIINYLILLLSISLVTLSLLYLYDLKLSKISYSYQNEILASDSHPLINNTDEIGTIIIPGIAIDSPVVQGQDNKYYLNHDINKSINKFGTIFLDYRSQIKNDHISFIYGHSSSTYDLPFNKIKYYLDSNFLNSHHDLQIQYHNELLKYQIINCYSAEEYQKINDNNKWLVIQTCNQEKMGSYIYLEAKMI
jgi:sortase B